MRLFHFPMNIKVLFLGLLFFFVCVFVFSQDYNDESVFIINSYNYNIKGITRHYALDYRTELFAGEEITGFSNFETFIQNKKQLLINERVLKDNVRIEYTVGEIEDGKYPVDLEIFAEDTWNIIALPYPKYDSNSGFSITIKARDYNFLGTMSALRFDIGYARDGEGRNFFSLMLDSGIPFYLFGLNWHFDFDHNYTYHPDMEEHHYYKNTTGISVELPVKNTTLTVGFNENLVINEENSDIDKPVYGNFQSGLYMSSNPYVSWKIPTTLEIGSYGELTYTPKISAAFNHEISTPLSDNRIGPFLGFSHSLGFGRIDWIGNFYRGYSAYIGNSLSYDFFKANNDKEALSYNINFTGIAHFVFNDFLGLSSRLMYRQWFNTYNDSAGDALRGILDKNIHADFIVSLNLDLPVRAFQIRPSEWFNNSKLKVFNFDIHTNPVIDFGLFKYSEIHSSFGLDNFLVSGGLEIVIFPEFFRSLFFRISLCFDLKEIQNLANNYEIFLGMELHY